MRTFKDEQELNFDEEDENFTQDPINNEEEECTMDNISEREAKNVLGIPDGD